MYLLLIGIAIVLFLIYDYRNRRPVGIPGPSPYPLVGTVPKFLANINDIIGFHKKCIQEYGDTYRFSVLGICRPDRIVFTTNPENVKHFLHTNFSNYIRHTNQQRFQRLFGTGIFISNGERWKVHRRTARPLFSKTSLADHMMPHFLSNAKVVVDILLKAAKTKEPIDIQEILFRYTLDSFGLIGFGHPINSLQSPVPFSEAFNRAQDTAVKNGRNPFVRYLPDKQFDKDIETLRAFVGDIIQQRKDNQDYHNRHDLLSRFMALKNEVTGKPYTDEELKDAVLNFFIAGRDTTACLMTWTLYLLSQNPKQQAKLVDVLKQGLNGEEPTVEQLKSKELDYLKQVLDETLRLYPPVPFDFRKAVEQDVLPDGKVIPKGMFIAYSAFWMGRSEKYWGKDAEEFIPERWERDNVPKEAFVPFHLGPQTCLGRSMAYLEAKTLLSILLQKFNICLVPGHPVVPKPSLVMPAKNGLLVTIEERV